MDGSKRKGNPMTFRVRSPEMMNFSMPAVDELNLISGSCPVQGSWLQTPASQSHVSSLWAFSMKAQ